MLYLPDLLNADFGLASGFSFLRSICQTYKLDISVLLLGYLLAGAALPTRRLIYLTIDCLSQIYSQGHFTHMRKSYKQIGMSQGTFLQAALEQRYRLVLPDYLPHKSILLFNV
jgi:hypothetical protein